MDDELRFHTSYRGEVAGPLDDDAIRAALREGTLPAETELRLVGTDFWAPTAAWATFAGRRAMVHDAASTPPPRDASATPLPRGATGTPLPRDPAVTPIPGDATGTPLPRDRRISVRPSGPPLPPPPDEAAIAAELPPELDAAPISLRDMLLYCVHEGEQTFGPLTGEDLRLAFESGRYLQANASVMGTDRWYPVPRLCARPQAHSESTLSAPTGRERIAQRCPTCLEKIPLDTRRCPHCAEDTAAAAAPPSTQRPGSIPDDRPEASWLEMHWRPLLTMGAILSLVCVGVVLRYLAPGRFAQPRAAARPSTPAPMCSPACWAGESCQMGTCVWQAPNDVGHVGAGASLGASPAAGGGALATSAEISGPFALPKDVADVLLLDNARFATALLTGTQIRDARSGDVVSLVSEAPFTRRLYRVGEVVYATAPQRIYVIDPSRPRVIKNIDLGAYVGQVTVVNGGRRALVSLPSSHAVAVLATEYHAEVDRIQFGDDAVGPTGTDDSGRRAVTATGVAPAPGAREVSGGAVYAFDPSRLASEQDRVRASLLGNPVSVLMRPDGEMSWVVARAEHALVPLEWLPSGAVSQKARIPTCKEPEQIELVRRDRRAVVRCDAGRALQIHDLSTGEMLRHVPVGGRALDLAVSPDGAQALVAISSDGAGALVFVDLASYETRHVSLGNEPTRVRLSPDGTTAIVYSDRSKVAWVLR
jgi:hypothetical protein